MVSMNRRYWTLLPIILSLAILSLLYVYQSDFRKQVDNLRGQGGSPQTGNLDDGHSVIEHSDLPQEADEGQEHSATAVTITEYTDPLLDVHHFTRQRRLRKSDPDLLVLLVTKDEDSWGGMPGESKRSFKSLLTLLHGASIDFSRTSLGILTSSPSEFRNYQSLTVNEPFAAVTLIRHPGYLNSSDTISRIWRHKNSVQRRRRGEIAKLRNYLMLTALQKEPHILWLDADVYKFSPGLIPAMIQHTANPEIGLITVRNHRGESESNDYDTNSWAGPRTSPSEEEKAKLLAGSSSWVASHASGSKKMGDLVKGTTDDELFRLDSVGGTVLYIRASLVRQGLSFTTSYIVGTSWAGEGWDGIETEGLCVLARTLGAYCYGMGGHWQSHHSSGWIWAR